MPIRIKNSQGDTEDLGAGFVRSGSRTWASRRKAATIASPLGRVRAMVERKRRNRLNDPNKIREIRAAGIVLVACTDCGRKRLSKVIADRQIEYGQNPRCGSCYYREDRGDERAEAIMQKPLSKLNGHDKNFLAKRIP